MSYKFFADSENNQSDIGINNVEKIDNLQTLAHTSFDEDFERIKCLENAFSEGKFEKPDDLLVEKIIQQVESLLSDANILKDKFLLKHMRRNKEGYISLKLISSLRKVKTIAKDWRIVAYSLKKSRKLQMNDEMTKIKRIDPLPLIEAEDLSRSVLAFYYPPGSYFLENLKKELNKLGNVSSIFTVYSKTDPINACVYKTLKSYEDIVSYPFAIVKFASSEEAANAVLTNSQPTCFLKLVRIVDEAEHSICTFNISLKDSITPSPIHKVSNFDSNTSFSDFKSHLESFQAISFGDHRSSLMPSITAVKSHAESNRPKYVYQYQKEYLYGLGNKDTTAPTCSYRGDGPGNNRWVPRKYFTGNYHEPRVVILRQPKGPDGTIGFLDCRRSTQGYLNFRYPLERR